MAGNADRLLCFIIESVRLTRRLCRVYACGKSSPISKEMRATFSSPRIMPVSRNVLKQFASHLIRCNLRMYNWTTSHVTCMGTMHVQRWVATNNKTKVKHVGLIWSSELVLSNLVIFVARPSHIATATLLYESPASLFLISSTFFSVSL